MDRAESESAHRGAPSEFHRGAFLRSEVSKVVSFVLVEEQHMLFLFWPSEIHMQVQDTAARTYKQNLINSTFFHA